MAPTSPVTLPIELYRDIFQYVALPADLCSAALSARSLCREAQRMLFWEPTPVRASQHKQFLKVITASPDNLALLVKNYSVWSDKNREKLGHDKKFIYNTITALNLMRNIKNLWCSNMLLLVEYLPTFAFQLRALSPPMPCIYHGSKYIMERFLPKHPQLRHLRWFLLDSRTQQTYTADPSLLPSLESLTGSWVTMKTFLPGRFIRFFQFERVNFTYITPVFTPFSEELGRLEFLTFKNCQSPPLADLFEHLHSLVLLQMQMYYDREEVRRTWLLEVRNYLNEGMLQDEALLSTLRNLRHLILLNDEVILPEDQWIARIQSIFAHNAALTDITLETDDRHWIRPNAQQSKQTSKIGRATTIRNTRWVRFTILEGSVGSVVVKDIQYSEAYAWRAQFVDYPDYWRDYGY